MNNGNAQTLYLDVFYNFNGETRQVRVSTKHDLVAFVEKIQKRGLFLDSEGRRTWIPGHAVNAVQIASKEAGYL